MKVKALEIRNFRSFDGESSLLRFNDGVNVIVGENNVGKSNILKSLELLKGRGLSSEDYYKGETDREILIRATVELSEDEMKHFASNLLGRRRPKQVQKIMSELENRLELEFSSKTGSHLVRFHGFQVAADNLYLQSDVMRGNYQTTEWEKIVERYLDPDNNIPLVKLMENELSSEGKKKRFHLRRNIPNDVRNMFAQKVKNFLEIRQCPSGTNQAVFESFDGALVADVLANLKNGNRVQRSKWRRIRQEFHSLFPNLELEVKKPAGEHPQIMIVKEAIEYEVPVSFVGAGIWEIVILLTHLFSFESMCFGMDMPELHFHHHTTRLLRNILKKKSRDNQFFIVTHSPIFVDPEKMDSVIVVREAEGKTVVEQLSETLDPSESQRLSRHLDESTREFFFSKAVLIVEGPTEKGALPIFSKSLEQDFDKYGIAVIEAGSQFSGVLARILRAFNFPYVVMHDRDALMYIGQSIELNGEQIKTSAVFYDLRQILRKVDLNIVGKMEPKIQSIGDRRRKEIYPDECFNELRNMALKYNVYVLPTDFEGILKRDRYEKFIREARRLAGRKHSKVISGRYVAEKIVENKLKIPKEFQDVINHIVKKSLAL